MTAPPVTVTKELLLEWLNDPTFFLMNKEVCLHHVSGLVAYYRFDYEGKSFDLPYRWCTCGKPRCGAPHKRNLESAVYDALSIIDDDDVVQA